MKVTVGCLALLLATAHYVRGDCVKATSAPNAPSLPQLPSSYRVHIEANVMTKNYTMDSEEYFDNIGNRAMLRYYVHGMEGRTIYSYDTDELFEILDDQCTVSNLTTSRTTALFGVKVTDGRAHVFSANEALRFGQKFGETYIGPTTVRGIPVNHWQGCVNTSTNGTSMVFTIDYYFSVPSWNSSTAYPAVPVRAVVQGNTTSGSQTQPLHNYYEFHRFEAGMGSDAMTFEVPKGIICPGRVSTRPVPKLPNNFYYRMELLDTDWQLIRQADIWYDDDYKLLRIDHKPTQPDPPYFTTDSLSEVHDFTVGVRYGVDRVTGNCTAYPITNSTFDAVQNVKALKVNGSYVIEMRNPLQFFNLDGNFTYAGQRYARDALCDVYIAKRDYYVDNTLIPNATFEYYFLDKSWSDLPIQGLDSTQSDFPFRLEITAVAVDFQAAYNFYDFAPGHPDVSVWDISPCYTDDQTLRFKVQMPGPYKRDSEDELRMQAHIQFAQAMGVSPLRLQGVSLEYDASNVYAAATLLGPTPSSAQFTMLAHQDVAHQDDKIWQNVASWQDCADLCVKNPDFVCNSFDMCPNPDGSVGSQCQLSRQHFGTNNVETVPSPCNHFSRTVSGQGSPEKSISEAYGTFRQQVYNHQIELDIFEDDESEVPYLAVDTAIMFGWTVPVKPLPSVSSACSGHVEATIPAQQYTYDSDFWYDSTLNLVRYDYRTPVPIPPYYSTYTLSVIHDFNTGIAYTIDRTLGNCSVDTIRTWGPTSTDGVTPDPNGLASGDEYVRIKGPLEIFYLNQNYTYAGQRTVRGVTCDVFEAVIQNFYFAQGNYTGTALFQYFFQSSEWSAVSDSSRDTTTTAPVMLNIVALGTGMYATYTYTDYSDQDPDVSVFDVAPCFDDAEESKHFLLTFDKPYHPYLDQRSYIFQTVSLLTLAKVSKLSAVRFSKLRVDYDLHNVFLAVTLLGQPDYSKFFIPTLQKTVPYNTANYLTQVTSVDTCAQACLTTSSIICNSFDLCTTAGLCLLSTLHTPDAAPINMTGVTCDHYSRAVNGTPPATSLFAAYETIKDDVYLGGLVVTVPTTGNQTVQYKAIGVRDDIIRPDPPNTNEDLYFKQFSLYANGAKMATQDFSLPSLAVDDCATECAVEDTFFCQSFTYCFNTGDCFISHLQPTDSGAQVLNSSFCFIYSRQYLNQYTHYDGQVLSSSADSVQSGIASAEDCARTCALLTDFQCKSFDYCANQKSCLLRKTHMLEAPKNGVATSSNCDHYSRDYAYDFNVKNGVVIPGNDDIVVADVTKADCAKMCVERNDLTCNSFEYCPNTTACRLSSAHPLTSPVRTQPSSECSLYTMKSISQLPPKALPQAPSTGVSGGGVAGIAIALLLVGLALGAGAMYLFNFKRRSVDIEMTSGFANINATS